MKSLGIITVCAFVFLLALIFLSPRRLRRDDYNTNEDDFGNHPVQNLTYGRGWYPIVPTPPMEFETSDFPGDNEMRKCVVDAGKVFRSSA